MPQPGSSTTGLKVAGCGASAVSGTLLLLFGAVALSFGRCTNEFGHDAEAHDTIGLGTIFGRLMQLGGEGVVWLGGVAVLAGILVLGAGVVFGTSLLPRKRPGAPPPPAAPPPSDGQA